MLLTNRNFTYPRFRGATSFPHLQQHQKDELVTNCDRLKNLKHSLHPPYAYTEPRIKLDIAKRNAQYPHIEIRILKNTLDRFLILDGKELYHLGASLKDLGKRWFAFSRMDGFLNEVLARLK